MIHQRLPDSKAQHELDCYLFLWLHHSCICMLRVYLAFSSLSAPQPCILYSKKSYMIDTFLFVRLLNPISH